MPMTFTLGLYSRLKANDPSLKSLELNGEKLVLEDIQFLCYGLHGALKINTHLRTLNLSDNLIDDEAALLLGKAIKGSHIAYLNLSNNNLSHVSALADTLKETRVTHLDLSHNKIDNESSIALAQTKLLYLDVFNNSIGSDGAQALAANQTLNTLDLRLNHIDDLGAEAFSQNRQLTLFEISGEISIGHQMLIKKRIEDNQQNHMHFLSCASIAAHLIAGKEVIPGLALHIMDFLGSHSRNLGQRICSHISQINDGQFISKLSLLQHIHTLVQKKSMPRYKDALFVAACAYSNYRPLLSILKNKTLNLDEKINEICLLALSQMDAGVAYPTYRSILDNCAPFVSIQKFASLTMG
jgi:hypothetical protein